jgi:hypothetical protein
MILLWRPVNIYVFFHEVSHALATWLCLGKVSNFTASAQGGQVTCSKSNTFIRLAPYCLPMSTILAVGCCFLWESLRLTPENWQLYFAGILGAGHAFHIGFTLWSMRRDQPDLQTDGWLFSVMVIWLANIVVLAAVLGMAFSSSYQGGWEAAKAVCLSGWEETLSRYETLGKATRALWIR